MKLFLGLLLGACALPPTAETEAVRDQRHLLYLRTVELPEVDDARELVICKWAKDEQPNNCLPLLVTKSNKRVIFAIDSEPQIDANSGRLKLWATVATPTVISAVVYLYSRWKAGIADQNAKFINKLPKRVAVVGGLVTVGSLVLVLFFDEYVWGGGERALVANFDAVFDRETEPSAANEVRDLVPLIEALAAEFDLVITRSAQALLKDG